MKLYHRARSRIPDDMRPWSPNSGALYRYEIKGASLSDAHCKNEIIRSRGDLAKSGAGVYGGSIAGYSVKTDAEIDSWISNWLLENNNYDMLSDNCQKFVFDLLVWCTDDKYVMPYRLDAGEIEHSNSLWEYFTVTDGLSSIRNYCAYKFRYSFGPLSIHSKVLEFQSQIVSRERCFGWFKDITIIENEVSLGNAVGARVGLNFDTGIGVRFGNAELHCLGLGGKIGTDGIQVDTPVASVNACNIL